MKHLLIRAASHIALLAIAMFGSVTLPAYAQSINVKRMPDSRMLEGSYVVTHYCDPEREGCAWFGEASSYPAQNGICPESFDITHAIWIGEVAIGNARENGKSTFYPEAARLKICLYVNGSEVELITEITWPQHIPRPNCADLYYQGITYSHIVIHHISCAATHRLLRGWSTHTEPGRHGSYAGWHFTANIGTWHARRHRTNHPVETVVFTLS